MAMQGDADLHGADKHTTSTVHTQVPYNLVSLYIVQLSYRFYILGLYS